MICRVGVETAVTFAESIGLILEGEVREGEHRGDDAGRLGGNLALEACDLAGNPEPVF